MESPASRRFAAGGNYAIDIDDAGVAELRVWRRPDVDSVTGARFAEEKIAHLRRLAIGQAKGLVFDLRDAPPVVGPKTEAALGSILEIFEGVRKRITMLVSDNSVQQLQIKRLVTKHAPRFGRVDTDPREARTWVALASSYGKVMP